MADQKKPDDEAPKSKAKRAPAKKAGAAKKSAPRKSAKKSAVEDDSPYREEPSVILSGGKDVGPGAANSVWEQDTAVKPATPVVAQTSGQPAEIPPGDLQRLLAGEHAGPHAFLGAHPLNTGGIIVRALAPDVMRAVVLADDGRTIEMSR